MYNPAHVDCPKLLNSQPVNKGKICPPFPPRVWLLFLPKLKKRSKDSWITYLFSLFPFCGVYFIHLPSLKYIYIYSLLLECALTYSLFKTQRTWTACHGTPPSGNRAIEIKFLILS